MTHYLDMTSNERHQRLDNEALAAATKRADDAERERDAALAVLRDVQWSSNAGYNGSCPCCYNEEATNHRANCALAACLKGAE